MRERTLKPPSPRLPWVSGRATMSMAAPATEFVLFREAPKEIRFKIWDFVMAEPRLVMFSLLDSLSEHEQRLSDLESRNSEGSILWNYISERTTLPIILQISVESRLYGLKKLKPIFRGTTDMDSLFDDNPRLYFNLEIDTLLLRDNLEKTFQFYTTTTERASTDTAQPDTQTDKNHEDVELIEQIKRVAVFNDDYMFCGDIGATVNFVKERFPAIESATFLEFGRRPTNGGTRDLEANIAECKAVWETDNEGKELPKIQFLDFETTKYTRLEYHPTVRVNHPFENPPREVIFPAISSWVGDVDAGPARSHQFHKGVKDEGRRCFLGLTDEMLMAGNFEEVTDEDDDEIVVGLMPKPEDSDDDYENRDEYDSDEVGNAYLEESGMVRDRYGCFVDPDDSTASFSDEEGGEEECDEENDDENLGSQDETDDEAVTGSEDGRDGQEDIDSDGDLSS